MAVRKNTRTFIENMMRFVEYRILHVNDSPHRIALGVGIGFFVAWTPLVGLHAIIVIVMAYLLRANKFVAILATLINNPLTLIPIFYSNYIIGNLILGIFNAGNKYNLSDFVEMFSNISFSSIFTDLPEFCKNSLNILWQSCPDLWLGSIIMAIIVGIGGHFFTYRAIKWHRSKHPHRRFE